MTEVILLGTFHFPDIFDIFSDNSQKELEHIANIIAKYKPDKIALEFPYCSQDILDKIYSTYDKNKMKEDFILGNVVRYGKNSPLFNCNELIQIGFRLGYMLGHQQVFGVDEDIELSDDLFEIIKPFVQNEIEGVYSFFDSTLSKTDRTISSAYHFHNSDEYVFRDNGIYIAANKVNKGNYEGSMMLTQWYERNLKIFSNLQNICENTDRVFLLIGSSHLKILRDLINSDVNMKLANVII
ncbi:MAG: hypothetical protein K2G32_11145 [Oscillospiraceae bacterium]|nr:hypothetical protein [Oscillospiraceae bacterium]